MPGTLANDPCANFALPNTSKGPIRIIAVSLVDNRYPDVPKSVSKFAILGTTPASHYSRISPFDLLIVVKELNLVMPQVVDERFNESDHGNIVVRISKQIQLEIWVPGEVLHLVDDALTFYKGRTGANGQFGWVDAIKAVSRCQDVAPGDYGTTAQVFSVVFQSYVIRKPPD